MTATRPQHIDRGFSVIRLFLDAQAVRSLPVGVVAWDSARSWYHVRILREDEGLKGLPPHLRTLLDTALEKLQRSAKLGSIGGMAEGLSPTQSPFWDVARERLASAIRLDPAKALEPTPHPDVGVDALFDAIVQPRRDRAKRLQRIDHEIGRALGPVANRLEGRLEVTAFKGARERVLRAAKSDDGMVVIEGVNLAASGARDEADALVSRLLRIRAGGSGEIKFVIGYLTSPGGLNGEGHMKDWIVDKVSPYVYDLNSERDAFRSRTETLLKVSGDTLRIL